ncbi:MAG: DUF2796 domain-containing protein [Rhodocyclaceae bacterium]|nr:MAG: DUF2796 domain-containing protein [Rhodocyclaceae bacterium]
MRLKGVLFGLLTLLSTVASSHGLGAHVHGVANLQVAVDGDTLTLVLESPLDNLLGFEHLPHTEKQKAAVRDMSSRLQKNDAVFIPTPAAACRLVSVKLESPVLSPEKKTDGDGHADLDGEFVFHCQHPEVLHGLDLMLFDGFPHLRQVDVQVATAKGQTAAKLSSARRRLDW